MPNKATREIKEAARLLVEDPEYRAALAVRLKIGEAGPIEVLLWHYSYGKPKEQVEVTGKDGGPITTAETAAVVQDLARFAAGLVGDAGAGRN